MTPMTEYTPAIGDTVRVGNGVKEWTVTSIWCGITTVSRTTGAGRTSRYGRTMHLQFGEHDRPLSALTLITSVAK
jgi:hypothetical protein